MVERLEDLLNPSKQLLPQPAIRPGYTAGSWNMNVKLKEAARGLKVVTATQPSTHDPRLPQGQKRPSSGPQAACNAKRLKSTSNGDTAAEVLGAPSAPDASTAGATEGAAPDSRAVSASVYVDLAMSGADTSGADEESQYYDLLSPEDSEHDLTGAEDAEGEAVPSKKGSNAAGPLAEARDRVGSSRGGAAAQAEAAADVVAVGTSGSAGGNSSGRGTRAEDATQGDGGPKGGPGAACVAGLPGDAEKTGGRGQKGKVQKRKSKADAKSLRSTNARKAAAASAQAAAAKHGQGGRKAGGRYGHISRWPGGRWGLQRDVALGQGKEASALQFQAWGGPGAGGEEGGEDSGLPSTVEMVSITDAQKHRSVGGVEGVVAESSREAVAQGEEVGMRTGECDAGGVRGPEEEARSHAGAGVGAGSQWQRQRRYPLLPSLLPSSCLQAPAMAPPLDETAAAKGGPEGRGRGRGRGRGGRGAQRVSAARSGVGGAQLWAPSLTAVDRLFGRQRQLAGSRIPPAVHVVRTAEEILRRRGDTPAPWWAVHAPVATRLRVSLAEAELLFAHAEGGCVEEVSGVASDPSQRHADGAPPASHIRPGVGPMWIPPNDADGEGAGAGGGPDAHTRPFPRRPSNATVVRAHGVTQEQFAGLVHESEALFKKLMHIAPATPPAPVCLSQNSSAADAPTPAPMQPQGMVIDLGGDRVSVFVPVDTVGLAVRPPPPRQSGASSGGSRRPAEATADGSQRRPLDIGILRGAEWKLPVASAAKRTGPWDYEADLVRVLTPRDSVQLAAAEGPDGEGIRFTAAVTWRLLTRLQYRWVGCVQHQQCLPFNGVPTKTPTTLPVSAPDVRMHG